MWIIYNRGLRKLQLTVVQSHFSRTVLTVQHTVNCTITTMPSEYNFHVLLLILLLFVLEPRYFSQRFRVRTQILSVQQVLLMIQSIFII